MYFTLSFPQISNVQRQTNPLSPPGTGRDCGPYGLSINLDSEPLFIASALASRAFENTCAIVFVNAGGPANAANLDFAGLSRVTLPFIGALGSETKDGREEGMSIVDVDMELVEEAEKIYRVRQDMATEGWHYQYRHGMKGYDGD